MNSTQMDEVWNILLWCIIIVSPAFALLRRRLNSGNHQQSPPGPTGWPVFGHMFNLGPMPHRTLAALKHRYGPIIQLKLGSVNTVVVQTADSAAELFKNHDLPFAERNITDLMRLNGYNDGSLVLAPYGAYWRVLRRICAVEMLTNKRVNETAPIRRECVDELMTWMIPTEGSSGVHVARLVFLTSFNMLGKLVLSRHLAKPDSPVGTEFFEAMSGIMEWAGQPNVSDLFPWLRWMDLQGLRRKMGRDQGKAMEIASGFVRERRKEREEGKVEKRKDFLDVLLDFEGKGKDEPDKLSEHNINIFILEIFLAGTETTSGTIEWAMTELLCNPDSMTKAKQELTNIIGHNKKMEETDIDNLPYLQAVVKETLRLHPPLPFLIPRKAIRDTKFMGYDISKNTQIFINAWAIGRDPKQWDEPTRFKPERFLGSNVEYKGQHFELIPFGAGRRMCAGVPLAHRMLHLVLGSLLHEFGWELEVGVTPEKMDMREKLGLSARKMVPLKAIPRKREIIR